MIFTIFQFQFMAFAIDMMHGRDPSSEMYHQLRPKKTKVMQY